MTVEQPALVPTDVGSSVSVEYCGEWTAVDPDTVFEVGRESDLSIDDNPFLHRHFLQILFADGLWWLRNVGTRLPTTVTDGDGRMQAWLAPGARLPIVFSRTSVIFTAGPTTYEFSIHLTQPPFVEALPVIADAGTTTVGPITLTASQHLLIVSLAEPMLRREGTGISDLPTSVQAAGRIGWAQTRFNRKLDNVCDKLDRAGISGLRGASLLMPPTVERGWSNTPCRPDLSPAPTFRYSISPLLVTSRSTNDGL
jgi:hypothetical protein